MTFLDDRYKELRDLLNQRGRDWTPDVDAAPIQDAVVGMADMAGAIAPDLAAVDDGSTLWRLGID